MKVSPLIVVLTLFTAVVHLVLLNLGGLQPMFILNGLGYLALLAAIMWDIPKGQSRLVHYAFIAYTIITIVAWAAIGTRDVLAYATKLAEVALVVLLWQRVQSLPGKK
jgi:hypothetical protein